MNDRQEMWRRLKVSVQRRRTLHEARIAESENESDKRMRRTLAKELDSILSEMEKIEAESVVDSAGRRYLQE